MYVLHPGTVRSTNDGQTHYVTVPELARLYGLSTSQWVSAIVADRIAMPPAGEWVHLYPRDDGNYSLPGSLDAMSAFGQSVENSVAHEARLRGNRQTAPYPFELAALVKSLTLPTRPGWVVGLWDMDRGQGSQGLTLVITIEAPNTYRPEETIRVNHLMPVPPAAYDARSWRRWLFEQIRLVDLHELMEGFVLDGQRPYAPSHGPGNDPYVLREPDGTDLDTRTSFRGEVSPPV